MPGSTRHQSKKMIDERSTRTSIQASTKKDWNSIKNDMDETAGHSRKRTT